jgi:hypothetical protein
MDGQDWTTVQIRRRYTKKELIQTGKTVVENRDPNKSERVRMAKLEESDTPLAKKRINPESLQALIRKRIEMNLTQDKADTLCAFPRNTFKDIESNRHIPSEEQKRRIHRNLSVQLKSEVV